MSVINQSRVLNTRAMGQRFVLSLAIALLLDRPIAADTNVAVSPGLTDLSGLSVVNAKMATEKVPRLCKKARKKSSYRGDYLDNFRTLKEGRSGWLYRDYDLKKDFGPSKAGYKHLRKLNGALAKRGTQLLIVPIPTRGLVETQQLGKIKYDIKAGRRAYARYLQRLRKVGLQVPALPQLFESLDEPGETQEPLFFARDHHWSSEGARRVAQLTAAHIKTLDIYPVLAKSVFRTHPQARRELDGSLQRAAFKICGKPYPQEQFDEYTTESLATQDLFTDLPEAEVVLVGTSNSKGQLNFNFSGFLSEYTQLDVLNLAQSGGGYGGALKTYLNSDAFVYKPPKLLIWELPGYYSLNNAEFFDELLSQLTGESL